MFHFSCYTLDEIDQNDAVGRIMNAALAAADPYAAVSAALAMDEESLTIAGESLDIDQIGKVVVIAFGKASVAMASAASDLLGAKLTSGIVVCKYDPNTVLDGYEIIVAGHPIPDDNSVAAGERILAMLNGLSDRDVVLFLISGGGSALITKPVEGVSLGEYQELTGLLLGCGASIDEINTIRRSLDQVKGGGLARAAGAARQYSLILSDVVNSPLEAIASGPTVRDPNKPGAGMAVLKKYGIEARVSSAILAVLDGSVADNFDNYGVTLIVGSNEISARAARDMAEAEGFISEVLTTEFQGEAREVGERFARVLIEDERGPLCLIAGGESTVTLDQYAGMGGRNLEVALGAVRTMADQFSSCLITLATDGDDGPTGAAGALVDGSTFDRAEYLGMDLKQSLLFHESYDYFDVVEDLFKIGPTGTNVNDLIFLFRF